jgi:phosphopantetheinyl transferase
MLAVPSAAGQISCVLVPGLPCTSSRDPRWLSRRERDFVAGIERRARRRDWLAGRLAAKLAISEALGTSSELSRLEVSYAADGRPVANRDGIQTAGASLSIGHCDGVGIAAASRGGRSIGIDIERLRNWIAEVADYILAEGERARMPAAAASTVLAYWTVKEAALKALGCGLRVHPRQLEVQLEPGDVTGTASWHLDDIAGRGWFARWGDFTWALADASPST